MGGSKTYLYEIVQPNYTASRDAYVCALSPWAWAWGFLAFTAPFGTGMEWDYRSLGLKLQKVDPKYSPILPSSTYIIRHTTIGILRGPCALQAPQLPAQVQSSAVLTVTALSWPWFGLQLYPVHPFCRQGQSPGKATVLAQLSGLSSKYMLAFLNLSQHRTQGTFIRQSSLKAPLWIAILSLVSTGILFLLSYLGIFFSSLNLAAHVVCSDFFVWTLNTSSWLSRTFFLKGCSDCSRLWQTQENGAHHYHRRPLWPYSCSFNNSSPMS